MILRMKGAMTVRGPADEVHAVGDDLAVRRQDGVQGHGATRIEPAVYRPPGAFVPLERHPRVPGIFRGDLMCAVVLANVVCILIAGIYNGLGKRRKQLFVGFNGHGELMRIKGTAGDLRTPKKRDASSFIALGRGLAIASVLFVLGELLGAHLEFLHPYAWTIIAAAALKIFGLLPKDLEDSTSDWGEMIASVLVPALLVGVSITYIKIDEVLSSMSNPVFIVLTIATVIVATLSSGFLGCLVKFHFVEAAITPGRVMADTGGSGDVSVLSAANRMHLMPFAALTNRVGGALVLFVTALLVPFMG
ncbi:2-hydroxycarboxylate transporter family protein [Arthrobacter crystallopoietes]|uniref:2-hydroxycarboxylate transporter family protein n=1 Tax=Crystallibacter crystallopoietes TaxID=37928 RepID=UPI003D6623C3